MCSWYSAVDGSVTFPIVDRLALLSSVPSAASVLLSLRLASSLCSIIANAELPVLSVSKDLALSFGLSIGSLRA